MAMDSGNVGDDELAERERRDKVRGWREYSGTVTVVGVGRQGKQRCARGVEHRGRATRR